MRRIAATLATIGALGALAGPACASVFVKTWAGGGDELADGVGSKARIVPSDLAYSPAGELYFIDRKGSYPRIRKLTADKARVETVAGTGDIGFNGDGEALEVNIDPSEMAFSKEGDLFFVDSFRIRRFHPQTNLVDTVAGDGTEWFSNKGPAVRESIVPTDLAFGLEGELYFIDHTTVFQGDSWRIRKLTPDRLDIETVAGGSKGEGVLGEIRPVKLKISPIGEVFFIDDDSRIRRANVEHNRIDDIAGTGDLKHNGDGPGRERSIWPTQFAIAPNGEIFFTHAGVGLRKLTAGSDRKTQVQTVALDSHSEATVSDLNTSPISKARGLWPTVSGDIYTVAGCGVWGCDSILTVKLTRPEGGPSRYVIMKMAGTQYPEFNGDGPVSQVNINPIELIISPAGQLVFADEGGRHGLQRIRALVPQSSVDPAPAPVVTKDQHEAGLTAPSVENEPAPEMKRPIGVKQAVQRERAALRSSENRKGEPLAEDILRRSPYIGRAGLTESMGD